VSKPASVNLKASICTENPTGSDIYKFEDTAAQFVENSGIERNGGVTNLHEQETTFATAGANSVITKDGKLLQVDASNNVRLNDAIIGNVGPCSVYRRGMLPGAYVDAAWTTTGTIIGTKWKNATVTLDEYDPATQTVINTRNIVFAVFGAATPVVAVVFIKYVDMHYADNQEFLVVISNAGTPNSYICAESGLTKTITGVTVMLNSAWRFGAGKYLIWNQGVVGSFNIGTTGAFNNLLFPQWATIDRFPGTAFSRAILTFPVYKTATNVLSGLSWVGYTVGGAWNATEQFAGPALAAVTATISNQAAGPGYSEASYTRSDTGAAIKQWYAPQFANGTGDFWGGALNASRAAINAYGALTCIYGNTSCVSYLRVGMINGTPSFLSVATIQTNYDALGVPLTNVGDFDPSFYPHISDDNSTSTKILYRRDGLLFFIDIRNNQPHDIQEIGSNLYQVNCISPFNVIDTTSGLLCLGANDFNGRFMQANSSAGSNSKVVAILKSPYVNSIDTGDKLTNSNDMYIPGMELPSFLNANAIGYEVDIFLDDVYSTSLVGFQNKKPDLEKANTLYLSDTRDPIAMGYEYGDKAAFTEKETIFTGVGVTGSTDVDYAYACYEIGNVWAGRLESFDLFGQRYVFDGQDIWLATFQGPIFSGRQFVCPATGMQLLAYSPTMAFFFSSFDNSIYIFDGGRSLVKFKRMNDVRNSSGGLETILDGVYSVRDNTLLLETAGSYLWIRDGVVTQNYKKANQTSITLYDTINGIQIANNTMKWIYSYYYLPTSTVVPLHWQSAYHGLLQNTLSHVPNWIVTLYSPEGRISATVVLKCNSFDQSRVYTQTATQTINPSDWDDLGFFRCNIRPTSELALASSVRIETNAWVVITDVSGEYDEESQAVMPGTRSN
jgi:hypothetical protein